MTTDLAFPTNDTGFFADDNNSFPLFDFDDDAFVSQKHISSKTKNTTIIASSVFILLEIFIFYIINFYDFIKNR